MGTIRKSGIVGVFTVHVDADELQCDTRALPYPTCVGTIDTRVPGGKNEVWSPAASKPRGYRAAAAELLESFSDTAFRMAREEWDGELLTVHVSPDLDDHVRVGAVYGYVRTSGLDSFLAEHMRPLSSESAPRTYVIVGVGGELGGWFVPAGSKY